MSPNAFAIHLDGDMDLEPSLPNGDDQALRAHGSDSAGERKLTAEEDDGDAIDQGHACGLDRRGAVRQAMLSAIVARRHPPETRL